MGLDPRFVQQNSTFADRQRSEPIKSGGFGTPNTRGGFQRSMSTNDSTYEQKSSYRDSQSSTGFKRSFSNENERRSGFGSETFDSSNRRDRNVYGYETERFQQKLEEKQYRVGFGNKESNRDMMGNSRRSSEEKDSFASGEPNFWPSGETGEDVGFHRQYSFPDSNAKISFRESMHSGGTSKPSTIVVFDRQNSCPDTKTAGFGDRSSSVGGFSDRSSNSGGFGDRSSNAGGFSERSSNVGGFSERSSNLGGFGDRSENDSSNSIFSGKSSNIGGFGEKPSDGFGEKPSGGFGFRDRNHNSISTIENQIRMSKNENINESDWIEANDESEMKTDTELNDLTTCMDMAGIREGNLDSEFDVKRTYLIPVKRTPAHLVVHGGFGLPPSS